MSQWGLERWFSRGETKIRVLSHVDTPTWHPIRKNDPVNALHLLEVIGDREEAEQMLTQLKACYVGKPYSLWAEPAMTEMR